MGDSISKAPQHQPLQSDNVTFAIPAYGPRPRIGADAKDKRPTAEQTAIHRAINNAMPGFQC